jgi:hypothetical protein
MNLSQAQADFLSATTRGRIFLGSLGCHASDTMIMMYDGSCKKVQDIVIGDLLMGPDSKPRTVKSLIRNKGQMYKIVPIKGKSFIVNEDHILSLKRTNCNTRNIYNVSVKEYLKMSISEKSRLKLYRSPVEFSNECPIDPYFLGLWLGDGHAHSTAVTTVDDEIIEYLDMDIRRQGISTFLSSREKTKGKNKLLNKLKDIGVYKNKHIPLSCLTTTRENRLQLLAGLIDSDGSVSINTIDYISKIERLSNDVAYLARSLGLAAYVTKCNKSCYKVSISGDTNIIPCKIKRKQPKKECISYWF